MSDDFVSVKCPSCGSGYVKFNNETYECTSCGSVFKVKVETTILKKLDSVIKDKLDPEDDFKEGYVIKPEYTEREFLHGFLKDIFNDSKVPSYYFDEMKLGSVRLINHEVLYVEGKASVNYSRSIGYDRKEQYTVQETKRDSNGNTYTENIIKERTVTDWKPDSGSLFGEACAFYLNDESGCHEIVRNIKIPNLVKLDKIDSSDLLTHHPSKNAISCCKDRLVHEVYYDNINRYVGDHIKEERHSGMAEIKESCLYMVPTYEIESTVRGIKQTFYSRAINNLDFYFDKEFPKEDKDDDYEDTLNLLKYEKEKTLKNPKLIFKVLEFILGLGIISIIIGFFAIRPLLYVGIIVAIISLIVMIFFNSKIKKIEKEYDDKINKHKKEKNDALNNRKLEGFKKKLVECGFSEDD